MFLKDFIIFHDSLRKPVISSKRKFGIYPYYGAQGIVDFVDDFIFDGKFVLLAEDGNNLSLQNEDISRIAHGKFWVNNHAHVLTTNKDMILEYLNYFLNSIDITPYITGSAQPKLNKENVSKIKIEPHSYEEQQHIVNILGSIDDKIENNEKMIKQFETLNRLYFHKNYILADKKDWKIELLGNCVDITRGSSPRPIQDYLSNKGMPWVKISDATENDSNYLTKTKEFIKEDGINLSKTVIPNTLIVSNSATPGLPKIMKITACVHDGWLIFTNYKDLTKEFVKYVIDFNKKELISSGNGSVFTNLKTEILKALKIYLPPKNILEQMNNYLKANLDIQYKLECNNIKLQELKQLYLKKFFG